MHTLSPDPFLPDSNKGSVLERPLFFTDNQYVSLWLIYPSECPMCQSV